MEDAQKYMQDNYEKNVYNPHVEKLQREKEKEAKDWNEIRNRFDKEKDFLDK